MQCKQCGKDIAGEEHRMVAEWPFCMDCFQQLMEKPAEKAESPAETPAEDRTEIVAEPDKEDVSVEVKENILSLKGVRNEEFTVPDEMYYRRERCCGTFARSFAMRSVIAPDKIKASFKNGVLKIELPRFEQERPKKINVDID